MMFKMNHFMNQLFERNKPMPKKRKNTLKHNKHITADEYAIYKELLTGNRSLKSVASLVKRSYFTISMVNKSTDFEDYHRLVKEQRFPKTPLEASVAVIPEPTPEPEPAAEVPSDGNFKTADFYISVTLRSLGIDCLSQTKDFNNKSVFEFNIKDSEAQRIVTDYYNRDLTVNAYDFVIAIKEFKERVFGAR